jgi:hypothetical protein
MALTQLKQKNKHAWNDHGPFPPLPFFPVPDSQNSETLIRACNSFWIKEPGHDESTWQHNES